MLRQFNRVWCVSEESFDSLGTVALRKEAKYGHEVTSDEKRITQLSGRKNVISNTT